VITISEMFRYRGNATVVDFFRCVVNDGISLGYRTATRCWY